MSNGFIIWFTGMPCSGKSTLALELAARLVFCHTAGIEVLDGDEVRNSLTKGLGFSKEDRDTNVHRIAFVSRLLARNGVGVIAATISPYRQTRNELRRLAEIEHIPFVEVYTEAQLQTLIDRDVKGLYKQALSGEIKNFTGINDPYESPSHADVELNTCCNTVEQCADKVMDFLRTHAIIRSQA